MSSSSAGLGDLVHQPQYVSANTRPARYAAPYYRPIIYTITVLIVGVTIVKYQHAQPLVVGGLLFALLVYTLIFVWRMRMGEVTERFFYRPQIQFLRGQLSLLGVTLMIGLLAVHGHYEHILWLLYVLATLLISEHNST